ncbi:hypothetical protein D3C71_1437620 [compost metagenome]
MKRRQNNRGGKPCGERAGGHKPAYDRSGSGQQNAEKQKREPALQETGYAEYPVMDRRRCWRQASCVKLLQLIDDYTFLMQAAELHRNIIDMPLIALKDQVIAQIQILGNALKRVVQHRFGERLRLPFLLDDLQTVQPACQRQPVRPQLQMRQHIIGYSFPAPGYKAIQHLGRGHPDIRIAWIGRSPQIVHINLQHIGNPAPIS